MSKPKSRNEIQADYRARAEKRGLVQINVVIPSEYRERVKLYAKRLRAEWEKMLK